jgi:gliding motility-associated-like protein
MKFFLSVVFSLTMSLVYSQDICDNGIDDDGDGLIDLNDTTDCACEGFQSTQAVPSLIPNSSFEDRSCCPNTFSQLNCADTWIQASAATSDYFNTCGYTSIGGGFAAPPNPLPDGSGYVGFYNGAAARTGNYKEYIGACLLSPMLAGNTYTLQFNIAQSTGSLTADISIFGTTNCANLPFGAGDDLFGCPANGTGWSELGTTSITFNNTWDLATLTFTPTQNITAVAIGGNCTPAPGTNYYFIDNLILAETSGFSSMSIDKTGSFCTDDIVLTASSDTTGSWQWYKEGVAIINETTNVLNVSSNNFVTGKYSVRLLNGIKCEIADYILDTNYIIIPAIINDSICANLDSGRLEAINITGENIGRPFQYFINGTGPFTDSVFTNLTPNTYQIIVSDTNLCKDTVIGEVVALALPVTDFHADTVCIGSSTTFTNNSIGTIANVAWSFGDGTFGNQNTASVQHLYNNAGTYMVKLVTETNNGCLDSSSIQVLVYDKPIADFTFINDCEGRSIQFNNTTTIGGGTNTNGLNWNWNFDNTNTSSQKNPTEVYSVPGIYDVTLSVSSLSACNADTTKQIEIFANPIADFNVVAVCFGEITQINDLSNVSTGAITTWNYETETVNYTIQNPMHQYASINTHNIKLVVTTNNGCKDSIVKPAIVHPLPIANFDFTPETLNIFSTQTCYNNLSSGAITYYWDYGFLGRTSVLLEECVDYPKDIVDFYDVFLRSTNQFGCSDSIEKTLEVQDVFTIYVSNTFTPNGDGKNDVFTPVIRGVKKIEFYIFDRWGKNIFYTDQLNKGWDGTYLTEELVQQDTYVYKIVAVDINDKKHLKEGHVNLVK